MSQGKEGSLCARQFSFPSSIEKINVTTGYESGLATQRQAQKTLLRCEHCPEASINSSKRTKFVLVFSLSRLRQYAISLDARLLCLHLRLCCW